MMANKRKYRRFIRRCETVFSTEERTFRGISSDFSVAGMFIRTQNPQPEDTVLDIRITLPEGEISKLTGMVRRTSRQITGRYSSSFGGALQKSGMGVELVETDAAYLEFLRSFLTAEESDAEMQKIQKAVEDMYQPPEQAGVEHKQQPKPEMIVEEVSPERERADINEMLIHLISTQQALINLLDRQGVINKRDIAMEMKKLRRR